VMPALVVTILMLLTVLLCHVLLIQLNSIQFSSRFM